MDSSSDVTTIDHHGLEQYYEDFKEYITGDLKDLPLSITGKPTLIQAMKTVDLKFRVPSRRSITSEYLPKLHEQIINKLKTACSSTDFL
ncbi:unnamed protein product [Rotaria sordida]|nr:unnamed protein product [Rotaria sordida]CAF3717425.1 unnamed protein product [Rotaria sordida]